jgi:hypothetical protein
MSINFTHPHINPNSQGLSHELRIALLSRGLPTIARIYDALFLNNISEFEAKAGVEICLKYGIGHNTLYKALKTRFYNQAPVFLKRPANAKKGRPHSLYICLSEKQLNSLMDVHPADYYALPHDALASNANYRAAVYHFQILTREGDYKRSALGKMLGIDERTVRRLDERAGVKVEPRYKVIPFNLDELPLDSRDLPGNYFLEDLKTKTRYPANRKNRKAIERKGHVPVLMARVWNYYSINPINIATDFLPQMSDDNSLNTRTRTNGGKNNQRDKNGHSPDDARPPP